MATQTEKTGLVRGLGFWPIWALGVGAVIGDGIFLLIGQGASMGGPIAIAAYPIAGLLLMAVMVAVSELAVGMPTAGSFHVWGRRLLGPGWGFMAASGYIFGYVLCLGAVGMATGIISNWFYQWTPDPYISAVIWSMIWLSVCAAVNLAGVVMTGKTQLALVAALCSLMVVFAIGGAVSGKIEPANYHPFAPYGFAGFWAAVGFGAYAYLGPLTLLGTGGECKKVTDLPKAMIWACITFLVLYTSAMAVMLGLVPYTELGVMEAAFTGAAAIFWGKSGALAMNIAAWLAAFTCLMAEVYLAPRLLYGLAKEKVLPSALSKISEKTKVPWLATVVCWIIGLLLIAMGLVAFLESLYVALTMIIVQALLITWFVLLAAAWRYEAKFPDEHAALPWKLPSRAFRRALIVVGYFATFLLVYGSFSGAPISILYFAIFVAVCLIYYFAYGKKHIQPQEYV